jgi:hypothetical protein
MPAFYIFSMVVMVSRTFRPDISRANIKANPPEIHANILLSGPNALSINGWA